MNYRVVKVSYAENGRPGDCRPSFESVLVQDAGDKTSALILAEVACSEHADLINVQYAPCGKGATQTGYTFRTNNGTDVWYMVKLNG